MDTYPHGKLADQQNSDEAIEFLRKRSNVDEPFFLGLGYFKPHLPFKFPEEFLGKGRMQDKLFC